MDWLGQAFESRGWPRPLAGLVSGLLLLASSQSFGAQPAAELVQLRNLGIAQLENEEPTEAESTFRRLVERLPKDPLPSANLAIALLRQGRADEALPWIDKALAQSAAKSSQGQLLAIRGEVNLSREAVEAALEDFRRAAEAAPEDIEILFALYRHGSTYGQRFAGADASLSMALKRLSKLRPFVFGSFSGRPRRRPVPSSEKYSKSSSRET